MDETGMKDWRGKRYWLIGASEGMGRALAQVMSRAGVQLVLSARSADRLDALKAELPANAEVVTCDVSDVASVRQAAEAAGEIDGMVWLAGAYWPMKTTDWDTEKVETMIDTNLTGAVRALGAVVPKFVARGKGHIVLTGSLVAVRGMPGAVGYGASKAGLMSLAQTMHADLAGTGVSVQLVNPGFVRTRLTDKNDFKMPSIMEPEEAAQEIWEHMGTESFEKSFPMGFASAVKAGSWLPTWAYEKIFR